MSSIGSKFLDASDIDRAIAEVAALTTTGPRVALAGGAAMQLYGSDRLTKDVDFVAMAPIQALPHEGVLSFGGYRSHSPSGVPVDLIVRADEYEGLYEEALDRAIEVTGVPVRVVAPEYMAAIKMAAARSKDEDDLRALILNSDLDRERAEKVIREWLGRYGLTTFRSFVAEAEWRASRER